METSKIHAETQFHQPCILVPTLVYKDDSMALCMQAQPTAVTMCEGICCQSWPPVPSKTHDKKEKNKEGTCSSA